jgi:hypothetical protein
MYLILTKYRMPRPVDLLAFACLSAQLAGAWGAEATEAPVIPVGSACAGMTNEGIRKRELMREMAAYIGETLPDDLQRKAQKFFDQVAKLKEDCERERGKAGGAQ